MVVKDRLEELQRSTGVGRRTQSQDSIKQSAPIYVQDKDEEAFFNQISDIRIRLRSLQTHISALETIPITSSAFDNAITEITVAITSLKQSLATLTSSLTSSRASDHVKRVQNAQINACVERLTVLCQEYSNKQKETMERHEAMVKKQILVVKPEISNNELESMIQSMGASGGAANSSQLFSIFNTNPTAADALANVMHSHNAILVLETSLLELQSLFMDLQNLVKMQDSKLRNIEHYVESGLENIDKANDEIRKTIQIREGMRKKMCWAIVGVLVAGLVLMLVFFLGIYPILP